MMIRQASIEDAAGMARVQVEAWRSTYSGILSPEYLAGMSVEGRKRSWEWTFRNPNPDEAMFVAIGEQEEVIGFSNGGRSRTQEYGYDGELYAIYLLQAYQGRGIGTRLVEAVVHSLMKKRYTGMMVWVLQSNPATGFYRKLGGLAFEQKEIKIGSDSLIEAAYGWRSLDDIRYREGSEK